MGGPRPQVFGVPATICRIDMISESWSLTRWDNVGYNISNERRYMKKDKTLLRFRIYDGDREYTDYAIIDNKQLLEFNYKEIISVFFYDTNVTDEQFLSDGRAVRIESEIRINNEDVKMLENLSIAFLHDFKLKELADA
jgi:hypothetical protein